MSTDRTFRLLIKCYCVLLVIIYIKIGLLDLVSFDQTGKFKATVCDYLQYYTASVFARNDNPAGAYDFKKLWMEGENITGQKIKRIAWNYPPTFLLIVYPFSFLSYSSSLFVWLFVTLTGYSFVLYKIAPHQLTYWFAITFPATFMNIVHGQNGFFFASLLGGGFLLQKEYPLVAGILLGLFACKPQLAFLIPLILIVGRRWKILASMTATVVVMVVVSAMVFGWKTWIAFFNNTSFVRNLFETGEAPWFKMPTFFISLRMAGFGNLVSYSVQAAIAIVVTAIVCYVCYQKRGAEISNAIFALGILLVTPYAFVYDLTILAIPIAYLAWQGYIKGWYLHEKFLLSVVWHMPLFTMFIALFTPLQVGPLILIACFTSTLYRFFRYERGLTFKVSN
jgi:hypothetical protein